MRTPALLAVLAILAVSFAGCSDGGDGEGDGTSSSSSSSASSTSTSTSRSSTSTTRSSTSTSTGPAANKAPTGSLSASVNGTNATFKLTGSDPDKDALVWDLEFGDGNSTNGTTLPANVTHSYMNRTGNITANFTITDGKNPVTYNVTITLGGAQETLFTFAGSTLVPNPALSLEIPSFGSFGGAACGSFNSGESGGDCIFTALDPSLAGNSFAVVSSVGNSEADFWDSCDPVMGTFVDDGFFVGDGEATGTVPAGAGCVILWDAGDAADLAFAVVG